MEGFNPRTRESATESDALKTNLVICFNPRTRESATKGCLSDIEQDVVSIHALVRVRQGRKPQKRNRRKFQSTHS